MRFTIRQRRSRPQPTTADHSRPQPTTQPPDPLTERDLLLFTRGHRCSRPQPTTQPPHPLTERDLLQFTIGQRRSRPQPRPSNGARSTAIYKQTAPQPTTADHATTRPSDGARSIAIYNRTAPQPTTQPPDPLTERDLLQFTIEQRRSPQPTMHATTGPSNGARSIAIYNRTAPQPTTADHSRPQPTTQPPDPLTERDPLQFTIEQRRSRPQPTTADHSRPQPTTQPPHPRKRSEIHFAIYNRTAPQPTTADQTTADHATTTPSNGARYYNQTAPQPTTADHSRPRNHQTL